LPEVFRAAGPYVDVVSVNLYKTATAYRTGDNDDIYDLRDDLNMALQAAGLTQVIRSSGTCASIRYPVKPRATPRIMRMAPTSSRILS
jgi:hypothetical protein